MSRGVAPDATLDCEMNLVSSTAPLEGKTIVVTRAESQSGGFMGSLTALGARVLSIPAIAIVAPDDERPIEQAILSLASYDWIIFTSTNAVDRFFEYLALSGCSEVPASIKCACVGSATAAALAARGVAPALIPHDYKAEGLIEEFDRIAREDPSAVAGARVLMPRALKAREILPEHLRALGFVVDVAPVYQTVPATFTDEQRASLLAARDEIDAVTFTSPSTVKNFFAALRNAGIDPLAFFDEVLAVSIGDVSTRALLDARIDRARILQASLSTTPSMIEALVAQFQPRD